MGISLSLQHRVDRYQKELLQFPEELATKLVGSELRCTDDGARAQRYVKRLVDIAGSVVGLLIASPILAALMLLVKLDSRGGSIFSHIRIGYLGKPFRVYKLRTLECRSPEYYDKPNGGSDPRVTRVGRFLRRASLDELPQLWNVLRGDMSLVGPRPEMPQIVAEYTPLERMRLAAKPGITGLWQISQFRGVRIHFHIEYDLYYVTHFSLLFDARIVLATLGSVIRGRGAH